MSAMTLILTVGLIVGTTLQKKGPDWIALDQPVMKQVAESTAVGPKAASDVLHLTLSLPMRDPQGMQKFVDTVSDPASPNYRQYATPEEIGARFGLPVADVKVVTNYLTSQGFKVTMV